VGLHVHLAAAGDPTTPAARARLRAALQEQWQRFQRLMNDSPTHLDSHHNVHRAPGALPEFLEFAHQHRLPLREHSPARYFPNFYGQWGGETHLEQISVDNLTRMLETQIGEGITELSCHPGYFAAGERTGYSTEREAELRTLCDPVIREVLAAQAIELINFRDLERLQAVAAPA
jgi:predicted glycoside hydrolase/deacetylase ChbG (UPF0249 family)